MTDEPYVPDRRPIAAREHSWSIAVAGWLADRGVTANAISFSGMIAGVLAGVAFGLTPHFDYGWIFFIVAAVMIQLRLLANMFDGMVALQTATASPVGELFNEVPDRVSDAAIFVGAGYAIGGMPELGYIAAIGSLFTAYVRAQGKVAGAPQEFSGPMAKPQRMAVMTIAALYAAFAPAAWQPQWATLPGKSTIAIALAIVAVGCAITTLWRLYLIGQALRKDSP